MWYYFLIDLPKESEVTTDGFRNFLLEYKDKTLIDRFINSTTHQHISIAVPEKRAIPSLIRESFVDRTQFER